MRRQVQGTSIPSIRVVPPKAGSEREVFVPAELIEMLSGVRNGAPGTFVFRSVMGHLHNRNSAGEEWRRIRAAVGFDDEVTLHTFRHTSASHLIASGCDVVTVQRALGHSQPSITLNVYSHLWPSTEDKTRSATATFMGEVLASADSERTAS